MRPELNLKPEPPKRRAGLWRTLGFLLSGPVAAFGAKNIAEGACTINTLAEAIKAGPQPDRRVRTGEDRVLDLAAIAFLGGTSEAEVERQLANRRRQTTWATYCYLADGCGFLLLWFWHALLPPAWPSDRESCAEWPSAWEGVDEQPENSWFLSVRRRHSLHVTCFVQSAPAQRP